MQCRVCRSFQCDDSAMDMSEVVPSDGKTLYDYFNECTQLKATINDHLPNILCLHCGQILHQAYNFIQEARTSDEELRKILPVPKNEPESVYTAAEEELSKDMVEEVQSDHTMIELASVSPKKGSFAVEDNAMNLPTGSTKNEPTLSYETAEQSDDEEMMALDEVSTYYPLSAPGHNGEKKATKSTIADDQQQQEQEQLNIVKEEIKIEAVNDVLEDSKDDLFGESIDDSNDSDESCDSFEFTHRKKRQYICDYCVYKSGRLYDLKKHIFELHKDEISCVKCCKVYELPAEIKLHKKLAHDTRSRPMNCDWCKDSNPMPKDELSKHIQNTHHSIYLKYFPRTKALARNEDDPFPCERCPKTFATIYELADHRDEHKFDCPLCFMMFTKDSSYRAHVLRTHNLSLTQLKEIVNGNEEPNMELIQKQTEEKEKGKEKEEEQKNHGKQYACPICCRDFKNRSSYSSHMIRTHNLTLTKLKEAIHGDEVVVNKQDQEQQERPEKSKQKEQKREKPQQREQQHDEQNDENLSQQNKYECQICLKGFRLYNSYREHILRKHGLTLTELNEVTKRKERDQPQEDEQQYDRLQEDQKQEYEYECPLCMKGFHNNSSYRAHVLRHHGLSLTQLKEKFNLKSHRKNQQEDQQQQDQQHQDPPQQDQQQHDGHIQESKYECPLCMKGFRVYSSHREHVLRTHGLTLTQLKEQFNLKSIRNEPDDQTQENKYECPLCMKGFRVYSSHREHVLRKHGLTITQLNEKFKLKNNNQKEKNKSKQQVGGIPTESQNDINFIDHEEDTANDIVISEDDCKDDVNKSETVCEMESDNEIVEDERVHAEKLQNAAAQEQQQDQQQNDGHIQKYKYECKICMKGFRVYTSHREHVFRTHGLTLTQLKEQLQPADQIPEIKYECPLCKKGFRVYSSHKEHVLRTHGLTLTQLKEQFNLKSIRNEPIDETEENKYECPLCMKGFRVHSSYREHVLRKHGLRISQLNEKFKLKSNQQKDNTSKQQVSGIPADSQSSDINSIDHEQDNANDIVLSEDDCKDDIEKSETVCEMESDNENEMVECKYCHRNIPLDYIVEHEGVHAERLKNAVAAAPSSKKEREYICAYCCQVFKTEFYVKLHEKKVHLRDIASEQKECPICQKKFERRYLKSHLRNVHTDGQKFPCDICGDLFKSNLSLKNHRKLHLERKFQCTMCDKGFIRGAVLKVHMRSHTGEEPYACNICEKRFKTKFRLDYHLQRHAGVKHNCKVCGKEFNRADQVRIHSYKHTGMPYQCTICDYKTGKREKFTSHLQKRHDKVMTNEELAEMFKKNTGRYPRVWMAKPAAPMDDGTQDADSSN